MKKTARVIGPALILIWICYGTAFAASAKLLAMADEQKTDMSRISFLFDTIPEFEVKQSGQRVQVILQNTGFAQSFQKLSGGSASAPLMRVQTLRAADKSVVELYFQDIPEFVDVSLDEQHDRFTVNVFWNRRRMGSRPGILGRKLGRLKPIREGAAAEKVIASKYSGRWSDFFRQFEWPPDIEIPIHFSFPQNFSPMVKENSSFFPENLREMVNHGSWERAGQRVNDLLASGIGGQQADFYHLLLAESLLHRKKEKAAREVLMSIERNPKDTTIRAWKNYFHAYALALAQKPFQADRLAGQAKENALQVNGLGPWFSILTAELALAVGNPEKALRCLEKDIPEQGVFASKKTLRRADARVQQSRFKKAIALYEKLASDLHFLRQHPSSLANWATLLYRQKHEYEKAYRYYFLLSEAIADQLPDQRQLVDYWGAMARLRSGQIQRARLMLWEIDDQAAGTSAGFRAWLKLMDLDVIGNPKADFGVLIPEYRKILSMADTRQVREEAFFKQILAAHLAGDNLAAVKLLGRFFDDYWAGELMPDARALFVEIFPGEVRSQVKDKAFFETLTLVAKHRDLLAQAHITYDFLHDLAESYSRAGFLEQAAATYLYLMDFEKKSGKRQKLFLPLIRIYHQQNSHDRVKRYALDYLERYPEGVHRDRILYYYIQALMENGQTQKAVQLLQEDKRPATPELDYLAGRLFFDLERYESAARYLARAASAGKPGRLEEIRFKRAEALFFLQKWDKATALYEKLLAGSSFQGPAGYRLVQIRMHKGQPSRALNLYDQLAEMEIGGKWLELAGATVETLLYNRGE